MESSSFPATNNEASPPSPEDPPSSSSSWTHLGFSRHHAIIACAVLFSVLVLLFVLWYYHHRRRRARLQHQRLHDPPAAVPLHPLHYTSSSSLEGNPLMATAPQPGDAPPRYEEVVPAQHHRLAGGMPDEEEGMVADGKMPLSEIPFEDVRLDGERAGGQASRVVGQPQRGAGDTMGHTNS